MFSEVDVSNFRGFQHLYIKDLARINVIIGDNNIGKSSLLEALFLRLGYNLPDVGMRLNFLRGINQVSIDARETWGWLFYGKNVQSVISVSTIESLHKKEVRLQLSFPDTAVIVPASNGNSSKQVVPGALPFVQRRALVCELVEDGDVKHTSKMYIADDGSIKLEGLRHVHEKQAIFLGAAAMPPLENPERLTALEVKNRADVVLEPLRIMEPRIKKISVGAIVGQPVVIVDLGLGEMLPISLAGNGMQRLLSVLLAIHSSPDGVVLVDEIENGMYHGRMKQTWASIAKAASIENVQIFATTHSFECLQAAHDAFRDNPPYELRVHRLERTQDRGIRAVTLDEETFNTAIRQGWEVR